jgi:hypothetical protein
MAFFTVVSFVRLPFAKEIEAESKTLAPTVTMLNTIMLTIKPNKK